MGEDRRRSCWVQNDRQGYIRLVGKAAATLIRLLGPARVIGMLKAALNMGALRCIGDPSNGGRVGPSRRCRFTDVPGSALGAVY
jgi:hypothetical protein